MPRVLVTGGNRGIGLELVRQLAARGDEVFTVVRQASPELLALGVQVLEGIDLVEPDAPSRVAQWLEGRSLDLLVHNAGLLVSTPLAHLDLGAVRRMVEVNTLAPLALTAALLPALGPGAKVAIVTSRMGSMADNTSGGAYGYRLSKAGVNAVGRSLTVDLAPRGVAVVMLHPGWVRTAMTGGQGLVDAPESAAGLLARMDETNLENSGRFVHMTGELLPW